MKQGLTNAAVNLPFTPLLIRQAALLPVAFKTAWLARLFGSIAAHGSSAKVLIETNGGISDGLRVLIPASKPQLVFGRPCHHIAERATMELARVLALHSDAFLDIGANEGVFTFLVAAAVGPARYKDLHLFEPDSVLFNRLVNNLRRNGITATANNIAVGRSNGMATFYRNLTDDSSGSLTEHFAGRHETLPVEVRVIALAGYIESHGIERACFKVDAEGAGVAVWEGAKRAKDQIQFLILEIIGPEAEAELPKMIIDETGWSAYCIRDFELIPSVRGEFEYRPPFHNWLFTGMKPGPLQSLLRGTALRIGAPPRA